MVPGFESDAKLFAALAEIDAEAATKVKAAGCVECKGGKLDRADYDRKPRGDVGAAADAYTRRTSFCCRVEGCRRRATPPSVRFLGQRVYVAVVVVASLVGRELAVRERGAPRRIEGVPARTVRRWLEWWNVAFVLTKFWEEAKSLLATPIEGMLPGALLARFGSPSAATLTQLLRLIAPITTSSVRAEIAMPV